MLLETFFMLTNFNIDVHIALMTAVNGSPDINPALWRAERLTIPPATRRAAAVAAGDSPKHLPYGRRMRISISSHAINNNGTGIWWGHKIQDYSQHLCNRQENTNAVLGQHDIKPHLFNGTTRLSDTSPIGSNWCYIISHVFVKLDEPFASVVVTLESAQSFRGAFRARVILTHPRVIQRADNCIKVPSGRQFIKVRYKEMIWSRTAKAMPGPISFLADGRSTKYDDPQESKNHRCCASSVDELPDSSFLGDFVNEHSDKGTPRNPTSPAEQGPVGRPIQRSIIWRSHEEDTLLSLECCSQLFKG